MMPSSEQDLTATLVNLYHLCPRQAWLHARGLRMEHTSDVVSEGKWLHEQRYPHRRRAYRELDLGIAKIDYYDPQTRTVHETKRSDKAQTAHEAQLKFYLYLLHRAGIHDAKGILEYPRLRRRHPVSLSDEELRNMPALLNRILTLIQQPEAPPLRAHQACKVCSYHPFCWSGEEDTHHPERETRTPHPSE